MNDMSPAKRRYFRKIIASALVGNMLEFYDLFMYGFLAVYISTIFFPTGDPYTSLLITLATFGVSYFIRPIGAIVIGSYADRHGRKAGMMLTIWAMGLGTAIIALAPSYATWGVFGAITVVLGKFIQGFSAGGEFGTSVSFVTEHAPRNRRGYFASYQVVGIGLATGLASAVSMGLHARFSADEILGWAWRLPFLLGLVIVPFGYWIRRGLDETPEFLQAVKSPSPVLHALTCAKARIACAIGIYSLAASTNYLLGVFIPLYAQKELGLSALDSMWGAVGYSVAQIFLPPLFGALSDRFGRLPMIGAGIVLTGLFTMPAFYWMVASPTVAVYVTCVTGLTACVMVFQGAMPAFLAELFPNPVRSTGLALVHNLNFTVVGGLSLLVCTWLAQGTGSKFIPAYYVMCTVAVAICCVGMFIRKSHRERLAQHAPAIVLDAASHQPLRRSAQQRNGRQGQYMRLRHIEVINAIRVAGTVSAAAELLSLTQPAVSQILQSAELQLGYALFTRSKSRLIPTREATMLFPEIELLDRQLDAVQQIAENLRERRDDTLRVLSAPALAQELVPEAVIVLRQRYPQVRVEVRSDYSSAATTSLALLEADVGILYHSQSHPAVQEQVLGASALVLIGHPSCLAPAPAIGLDALGGRQLVGPDLSDPVGKLLTEALRCGNLELDIRITAQSYHCVVALVHQSGGVGIVDTVAALGARERGLTVIPISPRIELPIVASTASAGEHSMLTQHFIDACRVVIAARL